MAQLPIDQPRDRADAGGVASPTVAVGPGQRVVAAQPPDGVLDDATADGVASAT